MDQKKYFTASYLALFLVATIFLTTSSCDRDLEDPAGPSLIDRFADFESVDTLTASQNTVDFAAGGTVFFRAAFNKSVDWILRIEGMQSGAVKVIEGFDLRLDESNATWNGTATTPPLFRDEECMVTLSIPEEPSYGDTLMITSLSQRPLPTNFLVTDFESDPGANIILGNFEFKLVLAETGRRSDFPAVVGDFYYILTGNPNPDFNPFFLGLVDIKSSIAGNPYMQLPQASPSQIYFNWFMWHDASPHAMASVQIAVDSNDSGDFEDGQDAIFSSENNLMLMHTGWRHYSFTMADLGMTSDDVEKIVAIRIVLLSDHDNQPTPPLQVRFAVDYLTFTIGQPLSF